MRFLTLAFAAALALSFLTVTSQPAKAVGLCADESGHNYNPDLYNNMGGPNSDCDGVFCYGYSGNGNWNTCVPPTFDCQTFGSCPPPPMVTQTSVDQAAICVVGDVYNTGSLPCGGLVCYGQSQYAWQTCVGSPPCIPPRCHIPPPEATMSATAISLCAYGDLYNNQAGQPSSGCDGAVCTNYSNGEWGTCVLDCTTDGCPRIEDPCSRLMCQPPFDP